MTPLLAIAWEGAPDWLSTPVLICGAGAIGLLVFSLVLKGVQKLVSLAFVIALVLGVCWFLRDAWKNKERFLPASVAAQLDSLADSTLRSPQALAAWEAAKAQLVKITSSAEPAAKQVAETQQRKALDDELTSRAASLRKEGQGSAADELLRLRARLRE